MVDPESGGHQVSASCLSFLLFSPKSFCFPYLSANLLRRNTEENTHPMEGAPHLEITGADPGFWSGEPSRVLTPRGALSPTFAKIRGFSLKIGWKLHDFEDIWGQQGGPGPLGPPWIRYWIRNPGKLVMGRTEAIVRSPSLLPGVK